MKIKTKFTFIDEIGLSAGDKSQPFMAIGMVLAENTSALHGEQFKFHYSYSAYNLTERKKLINLLETQPRSLKMHELNSLFLNNRHHEFKFENLGYPNLAKYKLLIDLIFNYDISFYGVIVDKTSPDFNIEKYGNYWHAYTKYLKLLLSQPDDGYHLINILDFLHKPNNEEEVVDKINTLENVVNSIQLDSKNTPLLQVADLLLGAEVFSKKIKLVLLDRAIKQKLELNFATI